MPACLVLALLVLAASSGARAGDPPFLYVLDDRGRLSLDTTLVETLPGGFDPQDQERPRGQRRWIDMVVSGPDRICLRFDGRVERSGVELFRLAWSLKGKAKAWQRLDVLGDHVAAIRSDGRLGLDGETALPFEDDGYLFEDVALHAPGGEGEPVPYVLRRDGAVFTPDDLEQPLFRFVGCEGVNSGDDGDRTETQWAHLISDPLANLLVAMRNDGLVLAADPSDPPDLPDDGGEGGGGGGDDDECEIVGQFIAQLPFPDEPPVDLPEELWVDIERDPTGFYWAVRSDGLVVASTAPEDPVADLAGDGRGREAFLDLDVTGGVVRCLRDDGQVYDGVTAKLVADLPNRGYRALGVVGETPDLSTANTYPPEATVLRIRHVAGSDLVFPVQVTDVDTPDDELVVAPVDLSSLPGATWDGDTRTVTWPAGPEPGRYSLRVSVDDGETPPLTFRYRIRLLAPDTAPRNRKPEPTRIDPVQVLVGEALELPILLADRDGDELVVETDPTREPFASGAVYDPETSTLRWTPSLPDVGSVRAVLDVSDGQASARLKIRLCTVSPLPRDGAEAGPRSDRGPTSFLLEPPR